MRNLFFALLVLDCFSFTGDKFWGFYGHRKITEMAIYTLPAPLIEYYKFNIEKIIEQSVAPDKRRYVIASEGPKHYIDLDEYSLPDSIPLYWNQALEQFGADTLIARGTVPWAAYAAYKQLINAFSEKNQPRIIRKSADLAHYLADANVPLHTTSNYNGQKTGQTGIHGFWETRLPTLYSNEYDFLVGKAEYVSNPQEVIWLAIKMANQQIDSVLLVDRLVTEDLGENKKYSFEDNGRKNVLVYSEKFSETYHTTLPIVELQMRRAVKLIGDFWFTAWIEAGQPQLKLELNEPIEMDSLSTNEFVVPKRDHEH